MDIETKTLKPCPLCNSIEQLMVYTEYTPTSKTNLGVVECTKKSCRMIIRGTSIEDAVEKWNKRPREDFFAEQLNMEIESHKQTSELYILALDEIIVLNEQLIAVEEMYQEADKHIKSIKGFREINFYKLEVMIYNMKSKIDEIRKNHDEHRRKSTRN